MLAVSYLLNSIFFNIVQLLLLCLSRSSILIALHDLLCVLFLECMKHTMINATYEWYAKQMAPVFLIKIWYAWNFFYFWIWWYAKYFRKTSGISDKNLLRVECLRSGISGYGNSGISSSGISRSGDPASI